MGKGLLRLNRLPEFSNFIVNPSNKRDSTIDGDSFHPSTFHSGYSRSIRSSSSRKSTVPSRLSTSSSKSKPPIVSEKAVTPVVKNKKEYIDQKKLVDDKILEKIQQNRFLNKRLLNNENIFSILTNPIIKITKKKYQNSNKYYRNGILKKRNIGKILYNSYVISSGPFKNYFSKKANNIFSRNLYSTSSDQILHRSYSSKHEYLSYNNINAKKLTYIKHNNKNCNIRMKSNDVVRIEKPSKALLKWNDHAFSRIPTISRKIHHFDASKYLYELNDSILTNEEELVYECCPKKYDSVCYRKNLYKLQKEILTDYIKESTAVISQKYPNIGGWGNFQMKIIKRSKKILNL